MKFSIWLSLFLGMVLLAGLVLFLGIQPQSLEQQAIAGAIWGLCFFPAGWAARMLAHMWHKNNSTFYR